MATRFCPACREVVRESDRFCTSCGETLSFPPQTQQTTDSTARPPRRWLKWGGIGCGGLIAVLILIVILGLVFGEGAEQSEEAVSVSAETAMPSPTPVKPIDPRDIWNDYLSNETRANKTWKGDWLTLKLGPIDEIEDGGRVRMNMDTLGWIH